MFKDFSKIEFDIVIAGGQSNCYGSGLGDVKKPFTPSDNIWYLNENYPYPKIFDPEKENKTFTISRATETVERNYVIGSFPLIFAENYIKGGFLKNNREMIIIKTSVPGAGFSSKKHWGRGNPLDKQLFNMTNFVLSLNPKNKVTAFLWHQGENDVSCNVSHDVHYDRLKMLLWDIQKAYGKNFPLIAGDFTHAWKEEEKESAFIISDCIKKAFLDQGGYFVETDGLTSNHEEGLNDGDTVHFSRKSLYELGERYYKAFAESLY